ncbi:hypothetical protein D9758_005602 [Tetrapyrgos nigripes]|uniref:DUF8191 domain-containing protein n=1 Tax=Tetrapyrgos nigripes TaxID=182062 RepID=A0A8H5GGY7_9AGAR|nr:hypothetical protein D9758_005602 [Tetrapyrgos nigripes]
MSALLALRNENRKLKDLVERYKRRVATQNSRIQSLLRTIQEISTTDSPLGDVDMEKGSEKDEECDSDRSYGRALTSDEEMDLRIANGWEGEDYDYDHEEEDEHDNSQPFWDDNDKVFRCKTCNWEVLDGDCDHCDAEYDMPATFTGSDQEAAATFDENATLSASSSSDRRLTPRGSTPLSFYPPDKEVPAQYVPNHTEVYKQLCQRGATPEMCTEFTLVFKKERGIVATLTPEIKEIFGGPEMKEDDTWYLALGRRVTLDEEDKDGYDFIVGLLEDVLFFAERPYFSPNPSPHWETVRLTGKTDAWITRPKKTHISYLKKFDIQDDPYDEGLTDEDLDASDEMLVTPLVESGPTRRMDEYEEDEEDMETEVVESVEPGGYTISFNARWDDGVWSKDGEQDGEQDDLPKEDTEQRLAEAVAGSVPEDMGSRNSANGEPAAAGGDKGAEEDNADATGSFDAEGGVASDSDSADSDFDSDDGIP